MESFYINKLLHLKKENSPLINEFRNGGFGIKRTPNNFSRYPVDLALEQTINADAANSLKGITHFSSSITARQRWAMSHSIRTKIISPVLQDLRMTETHDCIRELEGHRIEKDQKCLDNIIDAFNNNINPFDDRVDKDKLINIATGRSASKEIADFFLTIIQLGDDLKKKFIVECNNNQGRFQQTIKKNAIKNFAFECVEKQVKDKNSKKKLTIRMERDIFGRLLAISLQKKLIWRTAYHFPWHQYHPLCANAREKCIRPKSLP